RRWRETWPVAFEQLFSRLTDQSSDGRGVREFIAVLQLCRRYPLPLVEQAVRQALEYRCTHADGVELCLRQLVNPDVRVPSLDLAGGRPAWVTVGAQPLDLQRYDRLLQRA
ncbi:MAG: hypothetical protein MUC30_05190, partial [Bacteroidales bacterium]|nr:hypothetical protein [Bacteroidales bacterium]